MRVVAGEARGRRLIAPRGRDVRPTTDRVRESLFNALGSLGAVVDARVLDLFAGTGALGIEALSRGAASCTFVERDQRARAAVIANLDGAGVADRATVTGRSAEQFLEQARSDGSWFDLALLDPPYVFDGWTELLGSLPATVALAETDRELEWPGEWEVVRHKWYGSTLVVIARTRTSPSAIERAAGGPL